MSTLSELNVKPGDILECLDWRGDYYCKGDRYPVVSGWGKRGVSIGTKDSHGLWKVISRASDTNVSTPVLWKDMTPEQKDALLLAHHEGHTIQSSLRGEYWYDILLKPNWIDNIYYRIKPVPVVTTVIMSGDDIRFKGLFRGYKITFSVVDGKPDVTSIRMERTK